jgi:acetyltransferase-like isoleucine patch superfamily enzyme
MSGTVIQILLFFFPWSLRRRLMIRIFGFDLAQDSRIGFSIVNSRYVRMDRNTRIGHLTLAKGLNKIVIEEFGSIGNLNWITATPVGHPVHFVADVARDPSLHVARHAAITHRHLIDCTDRVSIGAFSTFAGWRSQVVTHAIDLLTSRQSCSPVSIGRFCFVGTGAIFLKGSNLPDFCVLSAGSVLAASKNETHKIYSGIPATATRDLDPNCRYFHREVGFVN